MTRRALAVIVVAAFGAVLGACGGGDSSSPSSSGSSSSASAPGPAVVSAAASLRGAFTTYGENLEVRPRFSFAGSDELAAQIRQGVKPDVLASANTKLPDQLFGEGLVERPRVFAGNRLVLAVPAHSKLKSVADAAKGGTTVAIGSNSVPIGSYTREVLAKLGGDGSAVLKNVRSEEPDVKGLVGKLTQGAVDAGFVYITDVQATNGRLRAIELARDSSPTVAYGIAVVKGAKHSAAAKRFVDGVMSPDGQKILKQAGFEPPPAS
jgi:molybdate transport system substrate-binding protein